MNSQILIVSNLMEYCIGPYRDKENIHSFEFQISPLLLRLENRFLKFMKGFQSFWSVLHQVVPAKKKKNQNRYIYPINFLCLENAACVMHLLYKFKFITEYFYLQTLISLVLVLEYQSALGQYCLQNGYQRT